MRSSTPVSLVCAVSLWLIGGIAPLPGGGHAPAGAPPSLAAAYQLAPELQISETTNPDLDQYHPAVAYDSKHGEYLVVWHQRDTGGQGRGIYLRSIAADGTPIYPPHRVVSCPTVCVQPAIAYNATKDEFLIVFMYDVSGDGSRYQILSQIIWPYGQVAAPPQLVWSWPTRTLWSPRVAWNCYRNEYLVIWNAVDTQTGLPTDVAGTHVNADGIADSVALHIADATDGGNYPQQADLTYNCENHMYLAVWRREYSPSDWDIIGIRLHDDGSLWGNEIPINTESVDSQSPRVVNSGARYLVVWQHAAGGGVWYIAARYFDTTIWFPGSGFTMAYSALSTMAPAVTATGLNTNNFLTVWQHVTPTGIALQARHQHVEGYVVTDLDQQFEVTPGGFWLNEQPAVAASPRGYFITYEGDSASNPTVFRHIYGRAWLGAVQYLPLIRR